MRTKTMDVVICLKNKREERKTNALLNISSDDYIKTKKKHCSNAYKFEFTKVVIQLDLHIETQIYRIYSSNQNLMN